MFIKLEEEHTHSLNVLPDSVPSLFLRIAFRYVTYPTMSARMHSIRPNGFKHAHKLKSLATHINISLAAQKLAGISDLFVSHHKEAIRAV
jgi:hypothetical protein